MIVDYVSFSAGGKSWKIPTNRTLDTSMSKDMYITEITGLIEPGESSNDSVARSYDHGSVLPPITYYRGKDMSFGVAFVGGATNAKNNYFDFIRALTSDWVIVSSSLGSSYTCKLVRVDENESLKNNYILATFQLISQEAF